MQVLFFVISVLVVGISCLTTDPEPKGCCMAIKHTAAMTDLGTITLPEIVSYCLCCCCCCCRCWSCCYSYYSVDQLNTDGSLGTCERCIPMGESIAYLTINIKTQMAVAHLHFFFFFFFGGGGGGGGTIELGA